MNSIYVCENQVQLAAEQFVNLMQSLCDLPHAATQAYVILPHLCDQLQQILPAHVTEHVCAHLHAHVGFYIQYMTYPDHVTLIGWSQVTREFLEHHEFDRTFCDLWRAHVHLLMLHAQSNWEKKWDQEQSCWFKHNDVCDLLKMQFEIWLKEKYFDQTVHN
jgi:hypothetical protein